MPVANAAELFKTVNTTDDWRHNDRERGMVNEHRRSVARGEELFNNTRVNITGVAGLNDDLNIESHSGLLRHLPRLAEYRTSFASRRRSISAFPTPAKKPRQYSTLLACRCSR